MTLINNNHINDTIDTSQCIKFHRINQVKPIIPETHYLGEMSTQCDHCKSTSFVNESFKCCHNGKVKLTPYAHTQQLLTGRSAQALNLLNNTCHYNSALAFASMGANLTKPPGHGPPCFKYMVKFIIEWHLTSFK